MPSITEMHETCRHVAEELRADVDKHRLVEIETVVRLLVPHLTRAVADGINSGRAGALGNAGADLVQMRDHLSWVDGHRDGDLPRIREQLTQSITCAGAVLAVLERL